LDVGRFFPAKTFQLSDARELLWCRRAFFLLLGVSAAFLLRPYHWAEVPAVFWQPISFFRFLPPPSYGFLLAGTVLFPLLCLLSAFRPGVLVSGATFLLGWVLLGLNVNYGKVDHYYSLAALLLLADFLSQLGQRRSRLPALYWQNWFFKFGQFALCALYFSSGLRKLMASGPAWFTSHTMQILLLDGGRSAGIWLGHFTWLPNALAAGSLAVELLSPFALLSPWLALFFVGSWCLMHLSIYIFLGPNFFTHAITFVVFIPFFRLLWQKAAPSPVSYRRLLLVTALLYGGVSAYEVAFRLDSWPLSSFPMYENNLSRTGQTRYRLLGPQGEVSMKAFPPFLAATLERSLRKTAEKKNWGDLGEKMRYLERRAQLPPGSLRLQEETWEKMASFDPQRPDQVKIIYPKDTASGDSRDR
jgi:hypothetical protein